MNSGGAAGGGRADALAGGARTLERDTAKSEHGSEAAAALWLALSQKLAPVVTPKLGEAEPPSAWRSGAGDMTPALAAGGAANAGNSDPKASERMVVRVDGGNLGELEVTLERKDGSLDVVIGMENHGLVGSVLADSGSLRAALERAGLSVQSLSVVPASEVGTVLAQRRLSPSSSKLGTEESAEHHENEKAQKRNHKRLTLIG